MTEVLLSGRPAMKSFEVYWMHLFSKACKEVYVCVCVFAGVRKHTMVGHFNTLEINFGKGPWEGKE